ncbi:MAG: 50S ribosomal protein L13 [Pelovirga sp.]
MSTAIAKEQDINRDWYVVDLENVVLGRAATEIARILRGKHKPIYSPSVDTGDFVIVVNADKIQLTGNKLEDKKYYHHTGYPGGIREINAEKLLAKKPEMLVQAAVKGMLPKNRLGRKMITKMKVYAGSEHPHMAQQPKELTITSRENG